MRAVVGASSTPITSARLSVEAPKAEMQTSANSSCGIAISASALRISSSSTIPRRSAATKPHAVPSRKATTTAPPAISSVRRPP